jgi:hypothetical protein
MSNEARHAADDIVAGAAEALATCCTRPPKGGLWKRDSGSLSMGADKYRANYVQVGGSGPRITVYGLPSTAAAHARKVWEHMRQVFSCI